MTRVNALRPYVEQVCQEYLGTDELVVDDEGDIPIRWGHAMYYVRVVDGDPPLVRTFSYILRDVDKSEELLDELNAINAGVVSARVFWHDGDVIAATEIVAESMCRSDLAHACWAVGSLSDWADTELGIFRRSAQRVPHE